ncbi:MULTISPECIES: NAD(P) transhydrogenase subunit alpha [Petrimonas]|jgi:NAD(P) transhydrogenase subunit alpha|uniref:proton-translocating NAD(P)(+) transhydrogenase n=1 Tax=Petrimonas mucosa TaxID=1642646 RepID=A0A1G4G8G3_9BACT|nr:MULTISPECIES: NAD(P) transhydrogenase subunit alpha [Petrimonas]MDD3561798.1 NAD(P) transhydrogenase subunit alpha [Petrimonas mucosa]SCM58809.1 NAD(P) transhydrogenase subunit alpha part 1 [Petrimonas mucosa]SFU27478.1 NAD(P) transhydrogenase subunit alpha [Porphyromonadaceae bacterium KHP3R9]HHT30553.1 NAD(P) transhydrogenase subunit alpha [Petrimonas mucosa]
MIVGIPKEIMPGEARVAATPETVKKFILDGMTVLVEAGAGVKSHYYDEQYSEAGAEMVDDVSRLFERADLILKVKEPLFNENVGKHEVEMMHPGQYLITFIHPASPVNHNMVKQLAARGVTGLTLDSIPRISRAQNMDALTSMSTCAGYKGIIMAADDLLVFMPQMFTAVGMLKPANVLVIGAGVAGLQALATAKRLGAVTYAMDIRPAANEQAKSLGARIIETGVPEELAVGQGGYAQKLPEEWLAKEREVLAGVLKDMDIVFCSALIPGKVAPILITDKMVESMKNGAVIVDISIDQGGNCEVTPAGKKEIIHNVMVQGIKNIPGLIPTSSTWMFSQNVYNLVKYLSKDGKIELNMNDEIVRSILVTHQGEIVHEGTKEAMGI